MHLAKPEQLNWLAISPKDRLFDSSVEDEKTLQNRIDVLKSRTPVRSDWYICGVKNYAQTFTEIEKKECTSLRELMGQAWVVLRNTYAGAPGFEELDTHFPEESHATGKISYVGQDAEDSQIDRSNAFDYAEQVMAEAVNSSSWIFDLKDNWDEEGSPSYKRTTWRRAVSHVVSHTKEMLEKHGIKVPPPRILPGPQGSIDIDWRMQDKELLINIPSDETRRGTFYGDEKGGLSIKGELNPVGINQGLLAWLIYKK